MDNKNQKPNAQEPIVIGRIKEEKERGPLGILLFFGFLIIFAVFLPNITEFINSHFNNNNPSVLPIVDDEDENIPNEEDNQEIIFYTITDDLSFTIDNLTFTNFKKTSNLLSFDVKNNKLSNFSFRSDNYYVELYNSNNMLLERIRINNTTSIATGETETIDVAIANNNATKLSIIGIKDENYPHINLTEDDELISQLTCTDNISSLEYTFKDGKLLNFIETLNLNNTNANYNSLLEKYRNINTKLISSEDVEIIFNELETSFSFSMTVNYTKASRVDLDELKYYNKDTEARVIKFELETSGFKCS